MTLPKRLPKLRHDPEAPGDYSDDYLSFAQPYAQGAAWFSGSDPAAAALQRLDDYDLTIRTWTETPISTVPEPSTYALMVAGLAGLFGVARRHRLRT